MKNQEKKFFKPKLSFFFVKNFDFYLVGKVKINPNENSKNCLLNKYKKKGKKMMNVYGWIFN